MITLLMHTLSPAYRRREAAELDAYERAVFDAVMAYEQRRHRRWP